MRLDLRSTTQQKGAALLAGPVQVNCTSVPEITSAYPIDAATLNQITTIVAAANAGLGLPGGGETFNWPDVTGAPHQWPAPQFIAFAGQVMNFVYASTQAAQGHTTELPEPIIVLD
jgi:hypothetical protein